MTDVALVERPQRREIMNVVDAIPALDTSRFEHMQRIADVMARSTMIPETLRTFGPKDNKKDLPFEQVMSNCFLVVNQAVRWGMDPFSVISCCSVVHGRLSYEGKLVAAVLDAKLGIQLHHHFTGDPASEAFRIYVSDQEFTPEIIAQLKPGISIPGLRLWDGSVAEWKTTGAGTPWTTKNYKRMLIYRGARDWTRIYESAIMLGVYTEDELLDLADDARARRAAPVLSLADRLTQAKPDAATGFSEQHVERETARGVVDETLPVAQQESSQASAAPPQPETEAPSESPNDGATPSSDASGLGVASDEPRQATESGNPAQVDSAGLPEGWERQYAAALGKATKPQSLAKYATQFWNQFGGWPAHKSGPNAATAQAIFDAYQSHFGEAGREAREVILHELGADQ